MVVVRKALGALVAAVALTAALAGSALGAHDAGPCGAGTGVGYAEHHIVPNAQDQLLGAHGHAPGEHFGFATCLGLP